jgi:hypothetical protein
MSPRAAAVFLMLASAAVRAGDGDIDIPSSDVNFGNKASVPGAPPQTGPLLHRKFAEKWRRDARASFGKAEATIAFALSGRCGERPKTLAPGWEEVLASARAEAARGEAMWETVPQISARHYMRATKMSDNLVAGAAAANCGPAL